MLESLRHVKVTELLRLAFAHPDFTRNSLIRAILQAWAMHAFLNESGYVAADASAQYLPSAMHWALWFLPPVGNSGAPMDWWQ